MEPAGERGSAGGGRNAARARPAARAFAGLLLLASSAGCVTLDAGSTQLALAADRVIVPIVLDEGVPLLDVRIGGQGPFRFKLDTGSGPMVVSQRLAERVAMQTWRVRGSLTGANGRTRGIDTVADLPDVELAAGATVSRVRAVVLPGEDLDVHYGGRPVVGILGFSAFSGCTLTVDYPSRRLVLSRATLPVGGDDRDVLPMTVAGKTPRVQVMLGEHPVEVLVDTGNDQGLIVPEAEGERLAFAAPPIEGPLLATVSGLTRVRIGRFDGDLHVGPHRVQQPLVSLMPCNGAMLGAELLRHFIVTLDARTAQARFAREAAPPVTVESRFSDGLGLRRHGGGWQVIDVIPGSDAERAGIVPGDLIRAIEDLGGGAYRVEVGQPGAFREVELRVGVLVR